MSLSGEVAAVSFGSKIAVLYKGASVVPPHWTALAAAQLPDGDGSRKPAVFPVEAGVATARVEVILAGADGTGAQGSLEGRVGGLLLTGTVQLTNGPQNVIVTSPLGIAIDRHVGDVRWEIRASSFTQPVVLANRTRLEVLVVLARPPAFFSSGVWAEALRFLVATVGLDGFSDADAVVEEITNFCHSCYNMRYATAGEPSAFNVSEKGGTFALSIFLKNSARTVNCYDLAAAICVLSGALGIPTIWLELGFFGFIKKTSLIGVGYCNNPLFDTNGSGPIVLAGSADRTRFQGHSFCTHLDRVLDSCIGPHRGREPLSQYFANTVDDVNGLGIPDEGDVGRVSVKGIG